MHRDVTNPEPKTQTELVRVKRAHAAYVDQALREVARRLLGRRPGLDRFEVRVDPANEAQAAAWAGTAAYLGGRIQSTKKEKPGRKPDMSPAAAAAMRAVLREVGGEAGITPLPLVDDFVVRLSLTLRFVPVVCDCPIDHCARGRRYACPMSPLADLPLR